MKPLQTEFVLEARVNCSAALDVGASSHGRRKFIPITGGEFEGSRIKGKVLPGGGDWQLVRPDGVLEIEARYTIQASDGALISVRNAGIIVSADGAPPYVRTTPQFEAPSDGPHAWLNKSIFVGTVSVASLDPLTVLVRVYAVA